MDWKKAISHKKARMSSARSTLPFPQSAYNATRGEGDEV
jgi:hypothetical protein